MQATLDFYNSTSQTPLERFKETCKASSQTWLVYTFFAQRRGQRFTSVQVARALDLNLNSARRALTDLSKKHPLLIKLESTRLEKFGKPNHYYTIK